MASRPPLLFTALLVTVLAGILRADDSSAWQQRPQPWHRQAKPVLSAYTTEQPWCQVVLYSPHVIFHDGTFRMWYLGTSAGSRSNDINMGYAESADGLDWREHPDNPVLTGKDVHWGHILQTPFVMFDEDEQSFKMWFVSGDGIVRDTQGAITKNDQRLGYATSRDGLAWKVHPRPIYPSGRSPSVIKESPNRYRMWMNSRPNLDQISGELYANIYEFSSRDGIRWERAATPAIRPSGIGRSAVYPFVLKLAGRYHMWYGCHTDRRFEIFHAMSDDGSKWSIDHQAPAFPARQGNDSFDSRYTSTPCVVSLPDRYLMYYSARDMRTNYVDKQGRTRKDGSGVYAHIGVAEMAKE